LSEDHQDKPNPSYEQPAKPLAVLEACETGNVASPTTLHGLPLLAYHTK
jgi:hypothetical protein